MGWILFCFTLPWTLTVGWGWVGLMLLIRAAERPRFEEHGILTACWKPWAADLWRYSTTVGRGIIYQPGRRRQFRHEALNRTEYHERIHVQQVEDLMLLSLVIGLIVWFCTGSWALGLALWWSGGAWQVPNFVTAGLRHGFPQAYRLSEHEQSAYSRTDQLWPRH